MAESNVLEIRNMGFVSTRVFGTDGVSLEIGKWANILEHMGYNCYYVCGRSDRPANCSFIIDELDYFHPAIREINAQAYGTHRRNQTTSLQIRETANQIKRKLYEAIDFFSLDLLIAQNSLTIPLNIPLGAALVEVLMETGMPCIAHHHDFFWERERFLINAIDDYLVAAFPPPMANIEHVVINSLGGAELGRRTGLPYRVIPNVMDFAHPPGEPDDYARDFRQTVGVSADDVLILQPTRILPRKGIHHSVELVSRLRDRRCKLVITHGADEEDGSYLTSIREYAELLDVDVVFADRWISDQRGSGNDGSKQYSIWDIYPHADLVAYPSTYEGFGNAFLEAVYFRKPIFCNRYTIFRTDIEPCGFQAIVMDGFLTAEVIDQVERILDEPDRQNEMVEHNYRLGRQFFSYERVEHELRSILGYPRPAYAAC